MCWSTYEKGLFEEERREDEEAPTFEPVAEREPEPQAETVEEPERELVRA